jgi:hypothetical protein
MSVTSLDRCLTELAEEHERHLVIVGSLQGCTNLLLADDVKGQLNDAISTHRTYMAQVDNTRAVLDVLKAMTVPELSDELSAQLSAQVEGVMAGLKPAHGRPAAASQSEAPKESQTATTLELGKEGPRGRRPQE